MKTLTKLRKVIQISSLLFFVTLLSLTIYPLEILPGLVDIYPRMSPLHLAATWLNTFHFIANFIPAVVVVALTFLLGRFFCGWICPMGVTLDITDRAIAEKKSDDSKEPFRAKWLKYALLAAVLVASYFEANLAGWLDPQSLITRTYGQVILPFFEYVADLLLRGLRPIWGVGGGAASLRLALKSTLFALQQQSFHGMVATALIFLSIAMAARLNRRFWCRFICPMGAALALFSRFSVVRRRVNSEKCIGCNKCVRSCRMGAIGKGGCKEFPGECVECMTCRDICPVGAISFTPGGARPKPLPVNFTRRTIAGSIGAGLIATPALRLSSAPRDVTPIRPPGAALEPGGEFHFMQTCLRCGQCMRVCPTNGLQPAWLENGLEGLWAPRMVNAIGYCEFECALCGRVCPSGAIKELPAETKQLTRIGLASFDKDRCIPWSRPQNCLVCEEHCPVPNKAIRLREEKVMDDSGAMVDIKLPYVVEEECIGCGICENKCPLKGRKGIHVNGESPQLMKAPPSAKKADSAAALLPDALAGWGAFDDVSSYGKDNLFEFINGGAEIYYEYGYLTAATREYANGDDSFSVDVFEMADPDASFGIFSSERPSNSTLEAVGDIGWSGGGMMAFRANRFYVKMSWYGSGDGLDVMKQAAGEIMKIVDAESGLPALLSLVPPTAPFETLTLIYGPLVMRKIFYLGDGDPAGFAAGARAVSWILPDKTALAVIKYDSAGKAASAAHFISDRAAEAGIIVTYDESTAPDIVSLESLPEEDSDF